MFETLLLQPMLRIRLMGDDMDDDVDVKGQGRDPWWPVHVERTSGIPCDVNAATAFTTTTITTMVSRMNSHDGGTTSGDTTSPAD